jgi:hypothetical protein
MPDAKYLAQLKKAILVQHGCGARHFTTVPVMLVSRGKVAWEGEVEVFDVYKHPKAGTCYAWSYVENGKLQIVAVLGVSPVNSAESAVKVALATTPKK